MNTIGVCSGKGSPGATFVAVNLAASLIPAGRDVLLIDLDPNGGDIAGYLGLDPRNGLYLLSLPGQGGYSPETLTREIEVRAGLQCIAGFPNPASLEAEKLCSILESASGGESTVVADLGRVDARSAQVANGVDLLLLVVRPDLISTHGAQRAKETLMAAGVEESKMRLVISGRQWKHAADVAEISEAVGVRSIEAIPYAPRAARKALRTQIPVAKGRSSKAFSMLASRIINEQQQEITVAAEVAVA